IWQEAITEHGLIGELEAMQAFAEIEDQQVSPQPWVRHRGWVHAPEVAFATSSPNAEDDAWKAALLAASGDLESAMARFKEQTGEVGPRLLDEVRNPWAFVGEHPQLMPALPTVHDPAYVKELFGSVSLNDAGSLGKLMDNALLQGVFLAIMRLRRENEELGRTPRHEWISNSWDEARLAASKLDTWWEDPRAVLDQKCFITRRPWLSMGVLVPFSTEAIRGAIGSIAMETTNVASRLYVPDPTDGIFLMLVTNNQVALGYATGRCHQEPELMSRLTPGRNG
ncbi:MAG: hypothetical protein ABIU97_03175, partial [Dehalococcoidia bacterium]